MIDVSIVIVNWNVKELLTDCLHSIIGNTKDLSYEIIVIDNASTDGSIQYLNEKFPDITLIGNEKNLGFAKANNQGFEKARGKYIFILNPDTLVLSNSLLLLYNCLEENQSVGIVGPKILQKPSNTTSSSSIQLTCARKYPTILKDVAVEYMQLNKLPLIGPGILHILQFPYNYEEENYVDAISGAAMLIRQDVLIEVGGFDEEFLHGGEDIHLCWKVNRSFHTAYLPKAVIIHYSGQSSRQNLVKSSVYNYLSNATYYNKVNGTLYSFLYKLSLLIIFIPIRLFIVILRSINLRKDKEIIHTELGVISLLLKTLLGRLKSGFSFND